MTAPAAGERSRRLWPLGLGLGAALVAYHLLAIAAFGTARLGGLRYFLADDDVLISMRYARNLARGLGLVYNPGEHVEGFTNPLLTFLGTLAHLAGVAPRHLPLALDGINVAASVATLVLLWRFWGQGRDQARAGRIAAALYLLAGQHLFYAHAGYEVYLQGLLLAYGVSRFDRLGPGGALLVGLLPLAHATSLPSVLVLALAVLAFHPSPLRRRLALGVLALLPAVAYQAFRVRYYGDWVPNTFWLKVGAGKMAGGFVYARAWVRLVLPAALLAIPAVGALPHALRRPDGARAYLRDPASCRLLVAVVVLVAHLGEVVSVGGDYFPLSRFLFPCTVLLAALAGRGAVEIATWGRGRPAPGQRLAVRAALAATALAAIIWPVYNVRANHELIQGRADWNVHHLALGLALRDNTPPETSVALFALGYAGYFGDRPAIDMLGKADRHIARRPANPHRAIAHNKTDFDYVLARRPDLVELALRPAALVNAADLVQASATNPHGYQAELALNSVFERDFAAHPVTDGAGRPIRLYARADSPAAAHAAGWAVDEAYFATDTAP